MTDGLTVRPVVVPLEPFIDVAREADISAVRISIATEDIYKTLADFWHVQEATHEPIQLGKPAFLARFGRGVRKSGGSAVSQPAGGCRNCHAGSATVAECADPARRLTEPRLVAL